MKGSTRVKLIFLIGLSLVILYNTIDYIIPYLNKHTFFILLFFREYFAFMEISVKGFKKKFNKTAKISIIYWVYTSYKYLMKKADEHLSD